MSFLASFLLIRYKLKQAKKEEAQAEQKSEDGLQSQSRPHSPITAGIGAELKHPFSHHQNDQDLEKGNSEKDAADQQQGNGEPQDSRHSADGIANGTVADGTTQNEKSNPASRQKLNTRHSSEPQLFCADPHLEQVSFLGRS